MPTYDDIVEGWLCALVLRDCETVAHSRQVTATTLELARALGVNQADMAHVRRGSLLHDIGKMGAPDANLPKPGPLSHDEWRIMKRHPEYAVELLAPFDFLRPALDIPYCHHERWDGTGYPRGAQGRSDLLGGAGLRRRGHLDALSHDRPYREAWSEERVRTHITRWPGLTWTRTSWRPWAGYSGSTVSRAGSPHPGETRTLTNSLATSELTIVRLSARAAEQRPRG